MDSRKIKMIFDGRILKHIDSKNPSRSGIYFTAYQLFLELSRRYDFYLYSDITSDYITRMNFPNIKHLSKNNWKTRFLSYLFYKRSQVKISHGHIQIKLPKLLRKIAAIGKTVLGLRLLRREIATRLANLDSFKLDYKRFARQKVIFFSPYMAIPEAFLGKNILRFTLLHDCIPLVFNECPKIHHIQNQTQDNETKANSREREGGGDWFYLLCKSLNSNDFYFANSHYTKQDFLKFFPFLRNEQITVTHLAADENLFKPNQEANLSIREKYRIPKDSPYFFSLCNIDKRKNLLFAIECFISFIQENAIEDLVFVLGGGYYDDFKEILKSKIPKEYINRIIFTGYLPDHELPILFSHALCSVYLSVYEGFGLPILESMQCGCPVIAANATSLPEVLGEGGILVELGDADDVKKAYSRIYSDSELREELRKKGLEQARSFSWRGCVDIMERVMNEKYTKTFGV